MCEHGLIVSTALEHTIYLINVLESTLLESTATGTKHVDPHPLLKQASIALMSSKLHVASHAPTQDGLQEAMLEHGGQQRSRGEAPGAFVSSETRTRPSH
jgi:hypothetical protein